MLLQRLAKLHQQNGVELLQQGLIGLEREALRADRAGHIARTDHPAAFGSPLTHSWLTTDYSEALLELITPPRHRLTEVHDFLFQLHTFVQQQLGEELLWSGSMPCRLQGEMSIRLAEYGSSNAAMMKTIYRRGLGYRYGRIMQVIAGIHFNYSFSLPFWRSYQKLEQDEQSLKTFISEAYFELLRNLQRLGWLIPYLFGASPAVDASFIEQTPTKLERFDHATWFGPWATSLRMGDIGYQNNKENEIGVKACYDNLEEYLETLVYAIDTEYPGYARIGVKVDGEYRQLNANILQIENEYYSTVRPKPLLNGNESPALGLIRRGVSYVELRSVDVNPFSPVGIELWQLHFLEALYLYCLLEPSPNILPWERAEIDKNEMTVAQYGRKPGLKLIRNGSEITLRDWSHQICAAMVPVCQLLDETDASTPYSDALQQAVTLVDDSDKTLSAKLLRQMHCSNEGYWQLMRRLSQQHQQQLRQGALSPAWQQQMAAEIVRSDRARAEIEAQDNRSFDDYLSDYFAQPLDGFVAEME
ncbi:glutamate--cysteine ligase [Ectothiorhodospiraceae bacterium BW-2]|nr:glutamate--cysteine ligase [Ectothiorhodospiraceae bacterium BW-2]